MSHEDLDLMSPEPNLTPAGVSVNPSEHAPYVPPMRGGNNDLRQRLTAADTRIQRLLSRLGHVEHERRHLAAAAAQLDARVDDIEQQLAGAARRADDEARERRVAERAVQHLSERLAILHGNGVKTGRVIHKVRWWKPTWARGADASGTRYYGPGKAQWAHRKAEKLRANGYVVEIHQAAVGTFEIVETAR